MDDKDIHDQQVKAVKKMIVAGRRMAPSSTFIIIIMVKTSPNTGKILVDSASNAALDELAQYIVDKASTNSLFSHPVNSSKLIN